MNQQKTKLLLNQRSRKETFAQCSINTNQIRSRELQFFRPIINSTKTYNNNEVCIHNAFEPRNISNIPIEPSTIHYNLNISYTQRSILCVAASTISF